ncbi:MAG: signal recognition particle-docking protein FtsY [Alphaproteobacteria bacterium]|nr:signal recognition particle-docking protein FtsY [Alphaproteobacteria bacterium]MCA0449159.1 signal recognition particle-docking protein FtsY [Pseudomonadota bacterium]
MSWFQRLKTGLKKSSARLAEGISRALNIGRLDEAAYQALEDALIEADLGPSVAAKLVEALRARKLPAETSIERVKELLAEDIETILAPVAKKFAPNPALKPHVVLVVGVNGSGKTTTIGKLASSLAADGKRVTLAAGDTFRAAAVSQLGIWAERSKAQFVSTKEGGDPAALAFEALEKARDAGSDVLLIDTAGRLHNKADLMDELKKVVRVIKKLDDTAPHTVLLVLDATIGQNAIAQVETFTSIVAVDSLALTKLDGSAKGGVLVAIANRFATPAVLIGVGEGIDDLRDFDARGFARGLLDLPEA